MAKKPAGSKELVRGILRWDSLALVVNSIVGAGIFGLPSTVHAVAGSWSLVAFVGCALVIALVVLCFAEVSSRFDRTGGPYLYARTAFGPFVGFGVGWLAWLARVTSFAALANLFLTYLHNLWPAADADPWRPILIVATVGWFTILNVIGVRHAAVVTDVFTIGKLVPLLVLVVAGLLLTDPSGLLPQAAPTMSAFSKAVLLLIFAYSGFEATTVTTGEMKDPRRNLPWAMLSALAIVVVLYILVQVVCIGVVPDLASSERPIADLGGRIFGAAGRSFATIGALISIYGTLGGIVLVAPRLLFAMAEEGDLPRAFATTHRRFHTPYVGILVSSAVIVALTLSGSFLRTLTISTIIRILTYIAVCTALLVMRRRGDAPAARFQSPFGVGVPVLALAVCVWLLGHSGASEVRDVAIAAALGIPIYLVGRLVTGRK